jgi:hypothetical protein
MAVSMAMSESVKVLPNWRAISTTMMRSLQARTKS